MNKSQPSALMTEGLTRTTKKSDAVWAYCQQHKTWISGGWSWDLPTMWRLHETGIGSETYARVRGLSWVPCKFLLYKWALSETT